MKDRVDLERKNGVKVNVKNIQRKISVSPKEIKRAVLKTLSSQDNAKPGEITVILVDDRQIRELNLMYRGRYLPTDVISFDNSINNREILADIVVSTQAAIRQARIFKTTALYEVYLYVIHGVLHLLGYDDKTAKQRSLMQKRTEYLLRLILNTQSNVHP